MEAGESIRKFSIFKECVLEVKFVMKETSNLVMILRL